MSYKVGNKMNNQYYIITAMKYFFFSWLLISVAAQSNSNLYPTSVDLSAKLGSERNLGETNLLIPLSGNQDHLWFLNLRGQIDNHHAKEFNLGIGRRQATPQISRSIWGVYGYYDHLKSAIGNHFHQLTLGGELLTPAYDFRINTYQPLSHSSKSTPITDLSLISDSSPTISYRGTEKSLAGMDIEAGLSILHPFNINTENHDLRLYAAYYYFDADNVEKVDGHRARIEYQYDLSNTFMPIGSQLTLGAEIQHDDPRGTQSFGQLRIRIPFGGEPSMNAVQRRMLTPVVRDVDIVTAKPITTEPAMLAETGTPLSTISTVDNAIKLFNATTNGDENSLIILKKDIETSLPNILKKEQKISVPGERITFKLADGRQIRYVIPGNLAKHTITQTLKGEKALYVQGDVSISKNVVAVNRGYDGETTEAKVFYSGGNPNVDESLMLSGYKGYVDTKDTVIGKVGLYSHVDTLQYDLQCVFSEEEDGTRNTENCKGIEIDHTNGSIRISDYDAFINSDVVDDYGQAYLQVTVKDSTTDDILGELQGHVKTKAGHERLIARYNEIISSEGALNNMREAHGIIFRYGDDFTCVGDNDTAETTCQTDGKTKIDYVIEIAEKLLSNDHDGRIQAALKQNQATMTLFDNEATLEENGEFDLVHPNGQFLAADETFVGANENKGFADDNTTRNAAIEETLHLIQNYGITYARPDIQLRLDNATNKASKAGKLSQDADKNGIVDDTDLPIGDLDDEYFAEATEAYFNLYVHTNGYIKGDTIKSNHGSDADLVCGADITTSKGCLNFNHPDMYTIVDELFKDVEF